MQIESIVSYVGLGLPCVCMSLPSMPKKEPRPIAVTIRLSKVAVEQLKKLANTHNLSQADVIEHLIREEYDKESTIKENNPKRKK